MMSLLLIAVLGVGPAGATLCDMLCVSRLEGAASIETPGNHDQATATPDIPADPVVLAGNAGSGHEHHSAAPGAAVPASHAALIAGPGRSGADCRGNLEPPAQSRTAVRADGRLVAPGAAVLPAATCEGRLHRQPAVVRLAAPPGGVSPLPTSLVLVLVLRI